MQTFEDRLNEFDRYVMNDIPIRLIRLADMKFVGRNDMKNHFQKFVLHWDTSYSWYPRPYLAHKVKYAILSHRWLDVGEPTYEEMKAGTAAGPGYEKLMNFCAKAREHGMEFAWSDTCCIDRNSSTELDESIRSMFRWYRNSYICIVHLAQSMIIEDILHDEWTMRGWTLQELLAPCFIKFFNKHWISMVDDDKPWQEEQLMKVLGRATGIPQDDLRRFYPSPSKVDERMTWAARRKTTRVEDVAYSLMGVFDVSLQIAYGEGGDRAFCRLIEAIMQAGDPSVLNWKGEAAKHHTSHAIPRSPQSFVGHRELKLTSGRLEMTMTSLGLRVPLVIIPLNLHSFTYDYVSCVTLDCPLCPTIKIDIETNNYYSSTYQYALGIVNYSLIGHGSCEILGIRGKSAGFILFRVPRHSLRSTLPPLCEPRPTDFVGLGNVSSRKQHFEPWMPVRQEGLVEVNFPNIPSESVFDISHKYLEIVYL